MQLAIFQHLYMLICSFHSWLSEGQRWFESQIDFITDYFHPQSNQKKTEDGKNYKENIYVHQVVFIQD